MSGPHAKAAANAARAIAKHGRELVLTRLIDTGATPWAPDHAEQSIAVKGVVTRYAASEVDGERITSRDVRILLGGEVEPKAGMRVRDDAALSGVPVGQWVIGQDAFGATTPETLDYEVIDVEAVRPGTTVVLYRVQARL